MQTTGGVTFGSGLTMGPTPVWDPNFNQVSLLLNTTGANTAQNNTFFAQTASAPQWYVSFNGTNQYLTAPDNAAWDFTGNFTIEAWVYITAYGVPGATITSQATNNTANQWAFNCTNTGQLYFSYTSGGSGVGTAPSVNTIPLSTWTYVTMTKTGSTVNFYINGVIDVTAPTVALPFTGSTSVLYIGSLDPVNGFYFTGNMSNFRITNGTALYSATFTPPAINTTLPSVTNTVMLTCQSATIIDNSPNAFVITNNNAATVGTGWPVVTRNGTPTQGTLTPFSQAAGYWSNYFNGSTDYLLPASNAGLQLGASTSFTIESWVYLTAYAASPYLATIFANIATGSNGMYVVISGTASSYTTIQLAGKTGASTFTTNIAANYSFALNTWYHVAIVNNASTPAVYVNGISQTLSGSLTGGWVDVTTPVIGRTGVSGALYYFPGYISNLRVVKGSAVYTSGFTVPTAPLKAVTNTQLLTCQSNYFKDNSNNGLAITSVGTPSVQAFEPFTPSSTPYNVINNGGSIYFNGTTDWLTTASIAALQIPTNPFTVETFVYFNAYPISGQSQLLLAKGLVGSGTYEYGFILTNTGGVIAMQFGYSTTGSDQVFQSSSTVSMPLNTWHHVAWSRTGTTIKCWFDGVLCGTFTVPSTMFTSTGLVAVGSNATGTYNPMNGYISNLRLVNGTNLYTANFTPPTQPLTAVTNTQLLLSGTNSSIYDSAGKNTVVTVSTAQVNTSVVKYGAGSIKFNGTTDYLILPSNVVQPIGTTNFTIECWVYLNASPTPGPTQFFYNASTNGIQFGITTTRTLTCAISNVAVITTTITAISLSTWAHVALVRNGSTFTIYIDGISSATSTNASAITNNAVTYVGWDTNLSYLNGYINNLRVTNGVARYTANFTPPGFAFPAQ